MVHHITTQEQYDELKATQNQLVVVDFSATWCGPCKAIAPVFEELAQTFPDVIFIHVDIDEMAELEDAQDVSGVPTFKIFGNGGLLHSFSGANRSELESSITYFRPAPPQQQ